MNKASKLLLNGCPVEIIRLTSRIGADEGQDLPLLAEEA